MSENVHDQLYQKRPGLVERMVSNPEVAGTVMGYLNLFMGISMSLGYPIEGIRLAPLIWTKGDVFRALVTFSRISVPKAQLFLAPSDFVRYTHAKAQHMARALVMNTSLEEFFSGMIRVLDNWCMNHGIQFEEMIIEDPIVTKDYVLQFKVKKKDLVYV